MDSARPTSTPHLTLRPGPGSKPPGAKPVHPLSAAPLRWLLYFGAAITLAVVLLALGRAYAILGMGSVLAVGVGVAGWRAGLWQRLRDWLDTRRGRWLFFGCVFVALIVISLLVPRRYAVGVLLVIVTGWGGLVAWQLANRWTGWWDSAAILRLRQWLHLPLLRWLIFGLVALGLYTVINRLTPPYPAWLIGTLLLATLPVVYARVRGATDDRVGLVRGLTLAAVLLTTLAYHDIVGSRLYDYDDALLLLGLGLIALILAVHINLKTVVKIDLPLPAATAITPTYIENWQRWVFGAGLVMLAIMAETNGRLLKIPLLEDMHVHVQFVLLLVTLALLVIGYGGFGWPRLERGTALVVLAVTGLALFLRFFHLELALRQFVDELNFAAVVQHFWKTPDLPLLQPMSSIAAFPYLYPYWQANMVEVFGRNLVGLRATSAIIGALTIPALYVLARTLFDRTTALIAILLLATFPPHLHFSRLGLNNIADPLVGTLALAFLARGIVHQRRVDYVLGGALLGLTHYFYEGGRLLFTPLALAWLIGLLLLWRPRIQWRSVVLVVVMLVLVIAPIYYALAAINSSVATRLVFNNTGLKTEYWQNLSEANNLELHLKLRVVIPLLTYFIRVEGSYFYRGVQGFIIPLLTPLFFLGIGFAVARLRRPGPLLLLLWFAGTTVGNSLLVAANHAPRYVVAFPVLTLLIAVGLRYTLGLLWPGELFGRVRAVLLAAVVVTLALVQTDFYFNTHLPVYNDQVRVQQAHRDGQDAAFRSLDFPSNTRVIIISEIPPDPNYTRGVLSFMRDDMGWLESIQPRDVTREYLAELDRGVDHAFFVEPGKDHVLEMLETYYYLLPPQNTPHADLEVYQQFPLYYAPYLGEFSDRYWSKLENVRPAHHHQPSKW